MSIKEEMKNTEDLVTLAQKEIQELRMHLAEKWEETREEHDYNMLELARMASDLMFQIMYLEKNREPWL